MSLMLADGREIFRTIKSKDNAALQRDLIKLEEWSNMWLLKFDPDICKLLTLDFLK